VMDLGELKDIVFLKSKVSFVSYIIYNRIR